MAAVYLIVGGFVLAFLATSRMDRRDRAYALAGFVVHIAAAFVQYALQEYHYRGDAFGYLSTGQSLAELLNFDFARFAPKLVRLMFHLDPDLPFQAFGSGTSTGTMSAIAGFFVYAWGPSLLPACIATSIFGWLGQVCIYVVARRAFAQEERTMVAVACLFVPSVVFWTSAFAKEAFVMLPFGILAASTYALMRGRLRYGVAVPFGVIGVAILKPYLLFPFVLAMAVWVYASRIESKQLPGARPLYVAFAIVVAVAGVAMIGVAFPEYDVSRLGETVAREQGNWDYVEGSVELTVGNAAASSLGAQLPYVPIALLNALFRPMLFDVRNVPMLAAALEMTVLAVLVAETLYRFSWARARRVVMTSPPMLFSLAFTLLFAVAVGLATRNLGSLSRYRMPMMPFYVTAVLVLRRRLRAPGVGRPMLAGNRARGGQAHRPTPRGIASALSRRLTR